MGCLAFEVLWIDGDLGFLSATHGEIPGRPDGVGYLLHACIAMAGCSFSFVYITHAYDGVEY